MVFMVCRALLGSDIGSEFLRMRAFNCNYHSGVSTAILHGIDETHCDLIHEIHTGVMRIFLCYVACPLCQLLVYCTRSIGWLSG